MKSDKGPSLLLDISPRNDNRGEYALVPGGERSPSRMMKSPTKSLFQRWRDGKFSIIPDENFKVDMWDLIVITALLFTAVELPFEVALITTPSRGLYLLSKCIDLIFCTDIVMSFNIAFPVANPQSQESYERRPGEIARKYMAIPFSDNFTAGWFWPDVCTVIPWELLPVAGILGSYIRLIRVLRLVRMLRLVRVLKLFKRWHTKIGMSFALLRILTCAFTTIMITHWLACLWAHLGLSGEMYANTNVGESTWLARHLQQVAEVRHRSGITDLQPEMLTVFQAYSTSLYFCTVVLTTVGFGDLIPDNRVEVITMIVTIFFTGITWAWVVGNIVNVITNMDVFGTQFNQIMDDLNSVMETNNLDKTLRHRIRRHVHESYYVQRRRHAQEAITWLSAGLQGELAIQSGVDKVCERIWYLKGLPRNILVELADEFKSDLFSPNDIIMNSDSASVIVRGACIKKGRLLVRDAVFGEDMILLSRHLMDTSCPRALSFLEVMTIQRDDMMEACVKYPAFNQRLRRAQIRLAVWRGFVAHAAEVRATQTPGAGFSVKAASAWDEKFFHIGEGEMAATASGQVEQKKSDNAFGWKECMELGEDGDDKGGDNAKVLAELRAVRESVEDSRSDVRLLLQTLEKRFSQVEGQVIAVNARMDEMSRGNTSQQVQVHQKLLDLDRQLQDLEPESVDRRSWSVKRIMGKPSMEKLDKHNSR